MFAVAAAGGGWYASQPAEPFWSKVPDFDPSGLPFAAQLQAPEPPTTSGSPNIVNDRDEWIALLDDQVSDTDGNLIVRVAASTDVCPIPPASGCYVNKDHVRIEIPGGSSVGILAIGSDSWVVDHIEVDCNPDDESDPDNWGKIAWTAGNIEVVHEDIVFDSCNIVHANSPTGAENNWTRSGFVNCRFLKGTPIDIHPDGAETNNPTTDYFVMGNNLESNDGGSGAYALALGRFAGANSAFQRVIVWRNHFRSNSAGVRNLLIRGVDDLAVLENVFRDGSFEFDDTATIGDIYLRENTFIDTQVPEPGDAPDYWEIVDNSFNGTESAFDTAVSSTPPDTDTGNLWNQGTSLPPWPDPPGDPASIP